MRPSVLSLRQLFSLLLVILAASVCTVCAEKSESSEKSKPDAPKEDGKPDSSPEGKPAPDGSGGDKSESTPEAGNGGGTSPVISHIIQQAPAVTLLNNGDIDPDGDCKKEIKDFCPKVKAGNSYLAECLQNRIEDEEEGATEFSSKVSPKCKDAVTNYKINLATNINYDPEMAKACKRDAEQHCKDISDVVEVGKIITCLREVKPLLSAKCRDHITRAQLAAAKDYRIDAYVHDFCKMDAYKMCRGVEAGSGRVNACLRKNRDEVSYDCRAALFRMDMENADDIRLNTVLFKACLPDKRKFCPDVFPGNGRVEVCLEEHMSKPDFTDECKSALGDRIEMMSKDYRLDPAIRRSCKPDINKLCAGPAESLQRTMDTEGTVMECLKLNREGIKRRACRTAVDRSIERSSRNIRYATSLAAACRADRETLCRTIPQGDSRVIRCLQEARSKLSKECSANLFDHEIIISESIDFNQPLKEACIREVEDTCEGVEAGGARVIRCLQDGNRKTYSRKCVTELEALEKKMGEDFRLNHRLEQACEDDANKLCSKVCDGTVFLTPCGGKVLHCLIEKEAEISAKACRKEVTYYIKMEVTNFGNDVIVAEACRDDVDKLNCAEIQPGEGRVHACLRKRRSELSERCAKEELRLEILESQNFDLRTSLKKVCVQERNIYCSKVSTGSARVFRCLAHNLGKPDFGEACRSEIKAKLLRRQQNWKLDVTLRTECKEDSDVFCADVDHDADKAEVTRCLIKNHGNLTESCRSEVSRATFMALNVYQEEGPITQVCADDAAMCTSMLSAAVLSRTGAVMACLGRMQKVPTNGTKPSNKLSPECSELLSVAQPPDVKEEFESNLKKLANMDVKHKLTDIGMWDNRKGVTITGYTALACFSALCTSVAMAVIHMYKRWRGIRDEGYVQVIKRGDL